MIPLFLRALYFSATLACAAAAVSAAEPAVPVDPFSTKLVRAMVAADYQAFIADGNLSFQSTIKKEQFDAVALRFSPRFKAGYELTYLGELRQNGMRVILSKLSFKDGGDDALATLTIRDEKVAGFWIR